MGEYDNEGVSNKLRIIGSLVKVGGQKRTNVILKVKIENDHSATIEIRCHRMTEHGVVVGLSRT
jgi:hypothetical protein